MSRWTYINGVVKVSTFPGRTQAECRYILDTVLDHLPKVTGEERNMQVYTVQPNGTSFSVSCDEFQTSLPRYHWLEVQEHYLLVLNGALRDRLFPETLRELNIFLNRLAKRLFVDDILVRLYDDLGRSTVICDRGPYQDMYETPDHENGIYAWWDYLLWEEDPMSGLPFWLAAKYYDDEDIHQEAARRMEWRNTVEKRRRKLIGDTMRTVQSDTRRSNKE